MITHSAASEVKIYNNTAASGTAILDLKWDLAPTASDTKNVDFPGAGIYLNTGIYVTVHGGTEGAYVAWDE